MVPMNEVNCKLYEREKGGLVGQVHELIIRCVGVYNSGGGRGGYDIHE